MAYRVAELMQAVESAPAQSEEKRALETELQQLIIDLWERRAAVPGAFDPGKRYERGLAVLERLIEDEAQWRWRGASGGSNDQMIEQVEHGIRRASMHYALFAIAQYDEAHPPDEEGVPLTAPEKSARHGFDRLFELLHLQQGAGAKDGEARSARLKRSVLEELATAKQTISALEKNLRSGKDPGDDRHDEEPPGIAPKVSKL